MSYSLPSPKELITKFDLIPSKRFGQNFLLDSHITDKIVQTAGGVAGCYVVEIGPGPCGLTMSILRNDPIHLTVIELDERIYPLLQHVQSIVPDALTIVYQDALEVDLYGISAKPLKVIANLPYNVATVLLIRWLRYINSFSSLTLMFQKEVAERIVAQPNSKSYGRLSVITQWLCEIKKSFDVPPGAFTPAPKVTSSVVHFVPRATPLYPANFDSLEKLVAAAFNQRRKMLRSALRSLLGSNCEELIASTGVDPAKRAEQLTIEEFCTLSRLVA